MQVEGKKIFIRPMEAKDMNVYREMINDPVISKNVVGNSSYVSEEDQMKWFERVKDDQKNLRFTIVTKEDENPVGVVTLTEIDLINRSGFHGIKLHSSCPKRQGIATEAIVLLMKYAFEIMNLNRLDGGFIDYNYASRELYKKCGWKEEGVKKQAIWRDGKFNDYIFAGILREEYYNLIRIKNDEE